MGLDTMLYADTCLKRIKANKYCSPRAFFDESGAKAEGLFRTIGDWRKAYDQDTLILWAIGRRDEDGFGRIPVDLGSAERIIRESKRILRTHRFSREDEMDLSLRDPGMWPCPYWPVVDTWLSKTKWKNTIRYFKEARRILKKDPNAKIYYYRS